MQKTRITKINSFHIKQNFVNPVVGLDILHIKSHLTDFLSLITYGFRDDKSSASVKKSKLLNLIMYTYTDSL